MAKASPIQTDFSAGEFSPLLKGRVDIANYKKGLETCLNYIPNLQGSLQRRSGSSYVAAVKTASKATRLVRFEFSVEQAYILEFGDQYIRFFKDHAQIESGGSPYEVATTYLEADLFELQFTQSADVLYIVHPDYEPATLSRVTDTNWTLADIDFSDGPYLPINTTATTLTPSATTGNITITASAVTGINGDTGFQSTDVGRVIRMQDNGGTWGWVTITGYTSTTQVSASVGEALDSTSGKTFWHMGLYSDTTGYPATVAFHEDRLGFAGCPEAPQRIDMSESGEYTSFKISENDGSVLDTNALSFTFSSNKVNTVRWLISDEKGLFAGTAGGEWIVRPSSSAEALTPTNITAKLSTTYGSANIQAIQAGKSTLFVQRAGRQIRELNYFFDVDGFRAIDLTEIGEHVTQSGLTQIAFQQTPQPITWCLRSDGVLAGLTYERDSDGLRAGWHRHIIGGVSDAAGNDAIIESIAVIPAPNGDREELWIVAKRYIDGATVRYIEYFEQIFDDTVEQKDAFFVDSGLTYDAPFTITGITKADPAVVTTSASHGFSNGDKVLISDVLGMTEVNTESYLVANKTATTFELTDLDGNDIDSSAFTTYVSGGEVRKYVSTITGLDHLEGETVDILGDGAVIPSETVSSGSITLDTPATTVHIGLGYNSDIKMLTFNVGSRDGTSLGKTQRIHRIGVFFHRSLGLNVGFSFDDLTELTFRDFADALSRAPVLYTGIRSETVESDYNFENQICIRQNQPLPSMILAIMPQLVEYDR